MAQTPFDIEQLRRLRMGGVMEARAQWPWKRSSPETVSCLYCGGDKPNHTAECDWQLHTSEEAYPDQDGIYRG